MGISCVHLQIASFYVFYENAKYFFTHAYCAPNYSIICFPLLFLQVVKR